MKMVSPWPVAYRGRPFFAAVMRRQLYHAPQKEQPPGILRGAAGQLFMFYLLRLFAVPSIESLACMARELNS